MLDGWGNPFTYAVTGKLASGDFNYTPGGGKITVMKSDLSEAITEKAKWVVVSHGIDGRTACSAAAAPVDSENCDGDRTFVDSVLELINPDKTEAYDLIVWR